MKDYFTHPRLLVAALWLVIIYIVGYLLYIAQSLIIPFVLAVFLWYLVNTLAGIFGRVRVAGWSPPRWVQYLFSGATLLLAVNLVINIITSSVGELVQAAPTYQANLNRMLEQLQARYDFVEIPAASQLLNELNFGSLLRGLAASFGNLIGNVGLIAVYMLFLFLEQRYIASKITAVSGNKAALQRIRTVFSQIDHDVRTYVGIKTFVSALTSVAAWIIMSLVGLDFAAFWALLIFVLNFIPNIGSLIATSLPSLLALVQFDTLTPFLVIVLGVGAIQMLVGNVLEPNLMGKSLNVSPLVIILSLVIWGVLWGIPGMFLCVPITVVVMIILNNFDNTRWLALLLSQDGRLKDRA
ncbi:hypothetical protein CAI21_17545 [Alkalilimnicola ehrlichii]|uniref:AI-2E family transporter n=1 Tax=Alkalilimnicola ehrlichii TaxID=351052 RepID=A0A3E0WK80_9GAMM|nr:AI-2E family transporter [Alkalilimnicola ehrlichii]RFA26139.1 hypothetical protein CAI21_17545 [Alkalilimnicola ehrlichii]RFA32366.1 hypothetical protein CAL65_19995 [Alkalilimnicola ehrlichii]